MASGETTELPGRATDQVQGHSAGRRRARAGNLCNHRISGINIYRQAEEDVRNNVTEEPAGVLWLCFARIASADVYDIPSLIAAAHASRH